MLFCFSFKLRGNPINAISTKGNLLTVKNVLLIGLMGLFFTGSLALYSEGMGQLTQQQQLMGWPVFMVAIIFTSQLWGWWHQESKDVMRRNKYYLLTSMLLLVIAVILLAVKT
jgi:L-rhamnose-H+ transport protein